MYNGKRQTGSGMIRMVIALIILAVSGISYLMMGDDNPITGESQRVALSTDQEIRLGLEAAPEMIARHGGMARDERLQATIDRIGARLLAGVQEIHDIDGTVYPFEFSVLADSSTINAFALPGGQTFITSALYSELETEGQVAGVMAHEIGHVIHRHGAEHLAKARLTQGMAGAAVVASGEPGAAQLAAAASQLINMQYGRDDELEADGYGLQVMAAAGYDPRSMLKVMQVLAAAGGDRRAPEFFSTHPNPANRLEMIEAQVAEMFPNGVPEELQR